MHRYKIVYSPVAVKDRCPGKSQRIPLNLFELKWSGRLDSNQRPPAPEAGALGTSHCGTLTAKKKLQEICKKDQAFGRLCLLLRVLESASCRFHVPPERPIPSLATTLQRFAQFITGQRDLRLSSHAKALAWAIGFPGTYAGELEKNGAGVVAIRGLSLE